MEALYGADWKDRLARGDGAPDDEEEEDEPQEEEESEELLSAAGPGPEPAGPSHGGDGGGGRAALAAPSGASSTIGEESVFLDPSVEKLKEVFKRPYEPEKESPQKFAKRLYRLAEALDLEGEAVDEKEMPSTVWETGARQAGGGATRALERVFPWVGTGRSARGPRRGVPAAAGRAYGHDPSARWTFE